MSYKGSTKRYISCSEQVPQADLAFGRIHPGVTKQLLNVLSAFRSPRYGEFRDK